MAADLMLEAPLKYVTGTTRSIDRVFYLEGERLSMS